MAGCFRLRGDLHEELTRDQNKDLHEELIRDQDKAHPEPQESLAPRQKGSHPGSPASPAFAAPQFAVVVHAVPTRYQLGDSRRWLEEDNKHLHIAGVRWLLSEDRRRKKRESSMVLFLEDPTRRRSLWLGGRPLRVSPYHCDR